MWRGDDVRELAVITVRHLPSLLSFPACHPANGSHDRDNPTSSIRFARGTPDGTDNACTSAPCFLSLMRSGGRARTSHIEIQNLAFYHLNYPGMVGTAGFEPTTPWSQARCSTKLSHVPILQGWTDELPARPGAGSEIRTRTLLVLSQAPLPIGLLRRGGGEGNRTLVVLLAEQVPDQHEQRPHGPAGLAVIPGRRTKT